MNGFDTDILTELFAGNAVYAQRLLAIDAAQALALLEFSHKAHADPKVGRYLTLCAVRKDGRSGYPFA